MPGYGDENSYGENPYKGEIPPTPSKITPTTGICLRFATRTDQGAGWSQYGGDQWIWVEPGLAPERVTLDNDLVLTTALDERTGKVYEISTYEGPTGSGVTKAWQDKFNSGYAGTEIEWEIHQAERRGEEEHMHLEHLQNNVYIRPEDESLQNTTGHDANGFRDSLEIDSKIFENGSLVANSTARDVPQTGNLTYDRRVEGHRLSVGYRGTASQLRIVRMSSEFLQKDTRGYPDERIMSEQDWQMEFSEPLFWLSRGPDPDINRATGSNATGSRFGVTTGPDSKTASAMVFTGTQGYSDTISLSGSRSIVCAIANIDTDTTIIRIGTDRIRITVDSGAYYLNYISDTTTHQQLMSWNGSGWAIIMITWDGAAIRMYEAGALINTFSDESLDNETTFEVMASASGSMFDPRLYNSVISESAFLYYYRDVTENEGNSICPWW